MNEDPWWLSYSNIDGLPIFNGRWDNLDHGWDYGRYWDNLKNYIAREGLVYIVNIGEDYFKIGRTTNIKKRFSSFKTINPFVRDVEQIVALIFPRPHEDVHGFRREFTDNFGAGPLERFIHSHLRERGKCFRNEIFKLTKQDFDHLFYVLEQNVKISRRKMKEPRIVSFLFSRRYIKKMLDNG